MMQFLDLSRELSRKFDYDLGRSETEFVPYDLRSHCEASFKLGVVVGPSGSGKSQALNLLGGNVMERIPWFVEHCVADHFNSEEEAVSCLAGAGLNSVPQWMKPRHILSNGEQYRADFARVLAFLQSADGVVCVDEFTSVVDRVVARSLCESVTRFLQANSRLVLATCHYDVLDWLNPDWVLDTATNTLTDGVESPKRSWKVHVFDKVGEIVRD